MHRATCPIDPLYVLLAAHPPATELLVWKRFARCACALCAWLSRGPQRSPPWTHAPIGEGQFPLLVSSESVRYASAGTHCWQAQRKCETARHGRGRSKSRRFEAESGRPESLLREPSKSHERVRAGLDFSFPAVMQQESRGIRKSIKTSLALIYFIL